MHGADGLLSCSALRKLAAALRGSGCATLACDDFVLVLFDLAVVGDLLLCQLTLESADLTFEELQLLALTSGGARLSHFRYLLLGKYIGIKSLNLASLVIDFAEQRVSLILLRLVSGHFVGELCKTQKQW